MHENLAKIKEYSSYYDWYDHISIYDLRFLVSQAEKVERYEKALKVISENVNWVGKGKIDNHIRNVGGIAVLTLKD